MIIDDTYGGCEALFSPPVPLLYTHHNSLFLMVWKLLLTFVLYNAFQISWNHVAMITSVALISIFLFGIKVLEIHLEEPLYIFPNAGFLQ